MTIVLCHHRALGCPTALNLGAGQGRQELGMDQLSLKSAGRQRLNLALFTREYFSCLRFSDQLINLRDELPKKTPQTKKPRDSRMTEQDKEYAFHPADLIEYAMDKPIGATRAALFIGLEKSDVYPDIIIAELLGNMELNQRFLKKLVGAVRKNPRKIIGDMPDHIQSLQLERDLGL